MLKTSCYLLRRPAKCSLTSSSARKSKVEINSIRSGLFYVPNLIPISRLASVRVDIASMSEVVRSCAVAIRLHMTLNERSIMSGIRSHIMIMSVATWARVVS